MGTEVFLVIGAICGKIGVLDYPLPIFVDHHIFPTIRGGKMVRLLRRRLVKVPGMATSGNNLGRNEQVEVASEK